MAKTNTVKEMIHANGIDINIYTLDFENDYISLTDIARKREGEYPGYVIQNWLRGKNTVAFLGLWEKLHNPKFNCLEFEAIKNEAGSNGFVLTPKRWIGTTNAVGIVSKAGRYAATYAHRDIAFEFASWISPEFKLYIIEEYQRLKNAENNRLSLKWNFNRELAKLNYKVHTEAIRENLLPPRLTPAQMSYTYASEADLLNVILFGKTAKQWREEHPKDKTNIRDKATIHQLLILTNTESYNAILIQQGKSQAERMPLLRELTIQQMTVLGNLKLPQLPEVE